MGIAMSRVIKFVVSAEVMETTEDDGEEEEKKMAIRTCKTRRCFAVQCFSFS
jgi:hypothetical protein